MSAGTQNSRGTRFATSTGAIALALTSIFLMTSCETTTGIVGINSACSLFPPIRWSQADSDETIRQVRLHNAAFDEVCR